MCAICLEWEKGKMTSKEALRNLGELIGDRNENDRDTKVKHYYDSINKILDLEVPMGESDPELDQKWYEENS